jgi:hypothetical protein
MNTTEQTLAAKLADFIDRHELSSTKLYSLGEWEAMLPPPSYRCRAVIETGDQLAEAWVTALESGDPQPLCEAFSDEVIKPLGLRLFPLWGPRVGFVALFVCDAIEGSL